MLATDFRLYILPLVGYQDLIFDNSTYSVGFNVDGIGLDLGATFELRDTGANAHGGAQVLVLATLLLPAGDLPWLLPWVLAPSLISGIATRVLANLVLLRWQWYFRGVA